MKFTLARAQRPRNPMVAPALFRQAGSHRHQAAAERQRGQRLLDRELHLSLQSRQEASIPARTPPDPKSP